MMSDTAAQVQLPSYRDLMYPTLTALDQLGGTANPTEINGRVIALLELTPEQLAIEYDTRDEGDDRGPKIFDRLGWARSYLRKLNLVDRPRRKTWELTSDGRHYLAMADGETEVLHREHELRVGKAPEAFLRYATERAAEDEPWTMTVEELLSEWEVSRRGSAVVARIARDLEDAGLETEPSFATVPLDAVVVLRALTQPDVGETENTGQAIVLESSTVTIGTLTSARGGVASVRPEDELIKAQSLMESTDYSQLAVTVGTRSLKGAISWETIARASLYGQSPSLVKDAMLIDPVVVNDTQPLLELVDQIANAGYVFVRDRTQEIVGIVTAADISAEFANLANPFLLIGEIEGWLRQLVDLAFSTSEDIAAYVNPDDPERQIEAAASLTFGEYVRVFEDPDAWDLLGLQADRVVFCQHLDEVRKIRNGIMHFSPDPMNDAEMQKITNLLRWVRKLADLSTGRPR